MELKNKDLAVLMFSVRTVVDVLKHHGMFERGTDDLTSGAMAQELIAKIVGGMPMGFEEFDATLTTLIEGYLARHAPEDASNIPVHKILQ